MNEIIATVITGLFSLVSIVLNRPSRYIRPVIESQNQELIEISKSFANRILVLVVFIGVVATFSVYTYFRTENAEWKKVVSDDQFFETCEYKMVNQHNKEGGVYYAGKVAKGQLTYHISDTKYWYVKIDAPNMTFKKVGENIDLEASVVLYKRCE